MWFNIYINISVFLQGEPGEVIDNYISSVNGDPGFDGSPGSKVSIYKFINNRTAFDRLKCMCLGTILQTIDHFTCMLTLLDVLTSVYRSVLPLFESVTLFYGSHRENLDPQVPQVQQVLLVPKVLR